MLQPVFISPVMQYIINTIRRIRLDLGLSQRDVSRFINSDTETNILSKIESPFKNANYTDHNLNVIANGFTMRAKEIIAELDSEAVKFSNIKSEYTVFDFYPTEPLGDDLQLKTRIDIPKSSGPSGILNAMLESTKFFNVPHTIREITDYCNVHYDKQWKGNNLTSTLDYAAKQGRLRKIELPDGHVQYVKA